MSMRTNFIASQSGAITVEKMVVIGGVIGLAIAAFTAIRNTASSNTIFAMKELSGSTYETISFGLPAASNTSFGGYYWGPIDGWSTNTGALKYHRYTRPDGSEGFALEVDGWQGAQRVTKDLSNLLDETPYVVSYDMVSGANDGMDVYFGGVKVASYAAGADGTVSTKEFTVVGGMGNGTNELTFVSHKPGDGSSSRVDNLRVK